MSIAGCRDICCTRLSKPPAPATRNRWFWSYMSLALPTLLYCVAKWPCQKSASFSWSGWGSVGRVRREVQDRVHDRGQVQWRERVDLRGGALEAGSTEQVGDVRGWG